MSYHLVFDFHLPCPKSDHDWLLGYSSRKSNDFFANTSKSNHHRNRFSTENSLIWTRLSSMTSWLLNLILSNSRSSAWPCHVLSKKWQLAAHCHCILHHFLLTSITEIWCNCSMKWGASREPFAGIPKEMLLASPASLPHIQIGKLSTN